MRLRRGLITKASPASVLRTLANPSNRCAVSEPVSATPASVLRTLANPSNRCAVSEPVSATPASVLRTLANPFTQGSLKTPRKPKFLLPFVQALSAQIIKTPHILPDNQSFFCLLFFSKKSRSKKSRQRKVRVFLDLLTNKV